MKKYNLIFLIVILAVTRIYSQQLVAGLPVNSGQTISAGILSAAGCDTVFSFPTNAIWSGGLASDGTHLWTSSNTINCIYKFSAAGVLLDTLSVPDTMGIAYYAGDLEFDGTYLLFAREESGILYKINPVTKTIVSQFPLPQYGASDPNDYGIAFDGTYIWHIAYSPVNMLYKLDATNGNIISSYPLNASGYILPIKFINGNLYGIECNNHLLDQIDTSNGNIINSLPWCLNYSLGLSKHNGKLWGLSSTGSERIFEFDTLLATSIYQTMTQENEISFENPVNDNLKINTRGLFPYVKSLRILDAQGRFVAEKTNFKNGGEVNMDISDLLTGIYFLRLETGAGIIQRKLIKL